jgi:hypothetical protein
MGSCFSFFKGLRQLLNTVGAGRANDRHVPTGGQFLPHPGRVFLERAQALCPSEAG